MAKPPDRQQFMIGSFFLGGFATGACRIGFLIPMPPHRVKKAQNGAKTVKVRHAPSAWQTAGRAIPGWICANGGGTKKTPMAAGERNSGTGGSGDGRKKTSKEIAEGERLLSRLHQAGGLPDNLDGIKAADVDAMVEELRNTHSQWYGAMTAERRAEILEKVFPKHAPLAARLD